MEDADIGKGFVEGAGQAAGFVVVEIEGAGIGQNDAFVVKAAGLPGRRTASGRRGPPSAGCFTGAFAEQAQGAEGRGVEAERARPGRFRKAVWPGARSLRGRPAIRSPIR